MALNVPDNNPQYDFDEMIRQAVERSRGQGNPDPGNAPPGAPAQVPMAPNSFGARVGGRVASIPQPPPAPAPVADVPAPTMASAITPGPASAQLSSPAEMPPAPPTLNLTDLMRQKADLGAPLDRKAVDPATGKQKYHMSIGQRILGSVANFASGMGGHGVVEYVGPGATNARYAQETADREKQLGNVSTQITDQEKLAEENRKGYEAVTQGALRQGQIEKYESQAQNYKDKLAERDAEMKTKDQQFNDKLEQERNKPSKVAVDAEDRVRLADQQGLKPGSKERKEFILTGKLPGQDGRQPSELETWMAAFRRDNGREPTADEIAKRKSSAADKSDQIEKDKDTAMQRAETKAQQRLSNFKMFDAADPKRSPEDRKKSIYDDLEKEKAAAQSEYETRASQNAQRGKPQSAPKSGSSQKWKVGDQASVGGKMGTIVGVNPKTKKPIIKYN